MSNGPRLFSDIEKYRESVALIDTTGNEISYKILIDVANEQMSRIEKSKCLIAIETASELIPLATYIGAMRLGHSVLLGTAEILKKGSRLLNTYNPTYILRKVSNKWVFDHYNQEFEVKFHKDLAVLLSTSGTTGNPKLVKLSHNNLIANAESIAEYLNITQDERACMTLPWSYSYGLSVINSHLIMGGSIIFSDNSVSESKFWEKFNKYKATSFAGVPYTFELLEHTDFLTKNIPNLRYFTQAGGKLPAEKVSLFANYAEKNNKQFFVMYGQTEATARMAYVLPDKIRKFPGSIGQAIPGGKFHLIDEYGNEVKENNIRGELVYSGPNVMMGYALNKADLIKGSELNELRTGDIATRNENNSYEIVGRASRFSKLFGLRISLDDLESLLIKEGMDAIVSGDDEGLVIAVSKIEWMDKIQDLITKKYKLPISVIYVIELKKIPRKYTGKIDYPEILKIGRNEISFSKTKNDKPLHKEIESILGVEINNKNASFVTLGGDSLNYVLLSMLLEKRYGYSPKGWESMPISKLESIKPVKKSILQNIDIDIFLRAIAIIFVVIHHVTLMPIVGGAITLLIIAGYNFGRFQAPKLTDGQFFNVIKPVLILVLPFYYLLLTAFFITKSNFFIPQYLLIGNLTKGFFINGTRVLTTWWFIESYIWLIIIFTLIFRSAKIRILSKLHPWILSLYLLVITVVIRFTGGLYFSTLNIFYKNSPLMLSFIFVIGWAIYNSKFLLQKVLITLITLILFVSLIPLKAESTFFIPAAIFLIWIPKIKIDIYSRRILSIISISSLFIYMTHVPLIHIFRNIIDSYQLPSFYWIEIVLVCLGFGISTWKLVDKYWIKFWLRKKDDLEAINTLAEKNNTIREILS